MTARGNRNVRKVLVLSESFSIAPHLQFTQHDNLFGDKVRNDAAPCDPLLFDSLLQNLSQTAIREQNSSRASSFSYDDYENEAAAKVLKQLHQMNNVLLGTEPIPSNYNKAQRMEYKEWMRTFPDLDIFGATDDKKKAMVAKETSTTPIPLNEPVIKNTLKISLLNNPERFLTINKSLLNKKKIIDPSRYSHSEYHSSLPFIGTPEPKKYSKQKDRQKKVENNLILPPVPDAYPFRSMSAASTRNGVVVFSAHSEKIQNKTGAIAKRKPVNYKRFISQ